MRWKETVENLEDMLINITGNVLVASGFVAYLGPFTVRSNWSCGTCPARGSLQVALSCSPVQTAPARQHLWARPLFQTQGQDGAQNSPQCALAQLPPSRTGAHALVPTVCTLFLPHDGNHSPPATFIEYRGQARKGLNGAGVR